MFLKSKEQNDSFNEERIVDNLRALSIDMIHEANSGHPGIALGAAPILYTVYAKHLKSNPKDSTWVNRDRFIMSCGHGSSLLYSTLYLSGYDVSLDDLRNFRNFKSITPGHPEYGVTPGVDMTTGPLGEGIASAVGVALAESYLREYYHKKGFDIINYYTYVLCSDGDLMEGASYEALSLAGTLKLNKLIVLYDSNNICLDGEVNKTFNTDIEKYFTSLNFNVLTIDGNDLNTIDGAIKKAKVSSLPTAIITNTTIGKYSKWEKTNTVHGTPLTDDDITNIKNKIGIRDIPFTVSGECVQVMQDMISERVIPDYDKWQDEFNKLPNDIQNELVKIRNNDLSIDNINISYELDDVYEENLRESSSKVLNSIAKDNELFIGGSADLSSSILTKLYDCTDYSSDNLTGRNINYGVREHAMGAIMNGISLAGIRNFGSTYLAFSDYMKPSIRLASMMNLANIYIFSHDSISVGKDGASHEAVEQLVSLRSIPNLEVFRPCDVNEIIGTYKYVCSKKNGPSAIILGRNKTKIKTNTSINDVSKGAYIIKKEDKELDTVIISTGEEVDLALDVSDILTEKGFNIRVVSMPSIELFKKQKKSYQEDIVPNDTKVFVIEASSSYSWYQFTNNEEHLFTVNQFGLSGDKEQILEYFGFTKERIADKIEKLLH